MTCHLEARVKVVRCLCGLNEAMSDKIQDGAVRLGVILGGRSYIQRIWVVAVAHWN